MSKRGGNETRDRILAAAEECFAARGFDATGVAEICERAGVTKGAFYYHFASKQALFLELLKRWLAVLDAQLEVIGSGAQTVPQALQEMTCVVGLVFRQADGKLPLFLEFWSQASRDPAVWQATIAPYRRYRDRFARMIEAGIAEGTLRPVDADVAASTLVSLAVGLIMQGMMDPDGADWGEVAMQSMRWFVASLETDSGAA